MDALRKLDPRRDFGVALLMLACAATALALTSIRDFPTLHTILDTAALLLAGVLAFLLWDMGWRSGQTLARFKALCFATVALLELMHVVTAVADTGMTADQRHWATLLRPATWPPAAYLLPLGIGAALIGRGRRAGALLFGALLLALAAGLVLAFQRIPRYTDPGFLGITRPSLALVPLLWIFVLAGHLRIVATDPVARVFSMFSAIMAVGATCMLYSRAPADTAAMLAHAAKVAAELYLLFSLTQIGTADTARRMQAERDLTLGNELLEARVAQRTAELEAVVAELRHEAQVRALAENRAIKQVEQLQLLQRITRAIGERQDLDSIFQVMVRSLETDLPVDFAALLDYEHRGRKLTVRLVGVGSEALARELAMGERTHIDVDGNGLGRCVLGELVYEPDISASGHAFPRRLAAVGLHSMVVAPLMVEERSGVFGVLVAARRREAAFSSGECEFLRMLCDHVSLAANQAQLHDSLQRAYDDLHLTQGAIMQQERLRVLGQMASGIAHDINNAISPVSLYVEMLLATEGSVSAEARPKLETIQRAIDDVAHTVARMGEFYRQRETQLELAPIDAEQMFRQVLDLTRARWHDMAQQRGIVVETGIEVEAPYVSVLCIASELREALINLVFNAIDAMPQGGRLVLRAGHALEAAKAVGRRVFIEVGDEGAGMDEETRRRCLEPFFTTKGERGSGLGLAMVYGIAQRHGADLDIVSAPGEGTRIRMTFPVPVPAPQSTASVLVHKIPSHTRILLIDDDPVLLNSLREVLLHEGHQVQTANGGRVGIEAFTDAHKAGKPFPVVITDLGMPHVDGRAVAAAIKALAPQTAILMLTGWGQRLTGTGEVPPEVHSVLSKPPRLVELRQKLAEISSPADAQPEA